MTTEIQFNPSAGAAVAMQGTATEEKPLVQQEKQVAPLLGGENVKVSSGAMSDLEKLVARLKNESESAQMSVAQRRISILQTVLDSMALHITESQKQGILEIEGLNQEKSKLEQELKTLDTDKKASEQRIAALDVQIQALENAVDQAIKDGEAHREQVAKLKAQRAEEQAKLDRIENSIASAQAKISGIDVKITAQSEAIGAMALNAVAAELRTAATDESANPERAESSAERDKAEKKAEATDLSRAIHEALDKIDAEIMKVFEENQEIRA